MSPVMAWTQANIDALKAAIATGALEVETRQGEVTQRVKYRSLADMQRTLAEMEAEVASAAPVRVAYFAHGRD
jgi:hypothetical protein